ncbi:placenta-expressed transcript 1 protein [Erinaceus europaeus]|uniref:Placenta-expressed transcript 1 protein n=1 Tax=Erinaceus europaeus TaxID=9365 RepID=A0A1S3WV39_ERIEU|nr:placenta-expressed transcript 1 protein [Erinaceus europaeus]
MAIPASTLVPPGLFLCLGLLFSFAHAKGYNSSCMAFKEIITSSAPGINVHPKVYERNTSYTVSVPVDLNITAVVLRAVDKNKKSAGSWAAADEYCNDSVVYLVKDTNSLSIMATWDSPLSPNITTVELQAFGVDAKGTARFSSQELKEAMTTTSSSKISTTRPTTTKTVTTTPHSDHTILPKNTTTSPAQTKTSTTARTRSTPRSTTSSANRAFLSPIADAIQILLVFFTSKILF